MVLIARATGFVLIASTVVPVTTAAPDICIRLVLTFSAPIIAILAATGLVP